MFNFQLENKIIPYLKFIILLTVILPFLPNIFISLRTCNMDSMFIQVMAWIFFCGIPIASTVILLPIGKGRILSMVYYILMWLYAFYMVPCEITNCYNKSETLRQLQIAPYILIPLLWLILLIEHFFCNESDYLKNLGNVSFAENFRENLRKATPIIQFNVTCYHYETRRRRVTRRDSDGTQFKNANSHSTMIEPARAVFKYIHRRIRPGLG